MLSLLGGELSHIHVNSFLSLSNNSALSSALRHAPIVILCGLGSAAKSKQSVGVEVLLKWAGLIAEVVILTSQPLLDLLSFTNIRSFISFETNQDGGGDQ